MKTIQIELGKLKPNPFKKQIDGGKLNKEQVKKMKASIKELGLMGSIPVVKIKNNYHLVSHHHRLQALKELKYKKIEVTVEKYSEDQLLRGMVMENLTQRTDDFKEIVQNLKCVRNHLKKTTLCPDSGHGQKRTAKGTFDSEVGSVRNISDWLNKQGEIMKHSSVGEHLQVADNLSKELYDNVETTHSGDASKRTDGKTISKSQAIILARIEDKKEQKEVAKALHDSRENKVRDQGKLITEYKKSSDEIKKKVRSGKMDLADVQFEGHRENVGLINLDRNQTHLEKNIELRENLKDLFADKLFLKKSPLSELEITYHYLLNWIKGDLVPFMNLIEEEFKSRGKDNIVCYDLTERRK